MVHGGAGGRTWQRGARSGSTSATAAGTNGDEPPNNWRSTFAGSAWTRVTEPDGSPGQWYLHSFATEQPDFDWSHPDVGEHFDRMLRFWFDRGVDGFRVDAVTVLGKAPGLPDAPPPSRPRVHDVGRSNPYTTFRPEGHEVWRRWRRLLDDYQREHPGRDLVMIAEAYTARQPEKLAEYVRPDEFHQSFAFDLLLTPWIAGAIRSVIGATLGVVGPSGGRPAWALNNHDVQRAVTRYGRADATSDEHWTDNNLVYTRAPVDLAVGTRRARAAIMLVLALPGATYLYQGEELGLPEVLDLPDEARQDPVWFRTGRRRARARRVPRAAAVDRRPRRRRSASPTSIAPARRGSRSRRGGATSRRAASAVSPSRCSSCTGTCWPCAAQTPDLHTTRPRVVRAPIARRGGVRAGRRARRAQHRRKRRNRSMPISCAGAPSSPAPSTGTSIPRSCRATPPSGSRRTSGGPSGRGVSHE